MRLRVTSLRAVLGPLVAAAALSPAQAEGDRAFGEYLSAECVTCHQLTGRSEGIPSIVGRPPAAIIAAMREYRTKKRDNPIMQTIAARLSEDEVAALASYFGSLQHE
jgi:cytochrome c553